jgi:hypothetical protein
MHRHIENPPRWHQLALYSFGGIVVGLSLGIIFWL